MKRSFKEFISINDLPVPPIIKKLEEKNNDLRKENDELKKINKDLKNKNENNISIEKENNDLRKENDELKKKIKDLKNKNENNISVIISSKDQNVHYSLICNKNDDFKTIEEKFYAKFPDYREKESENSFSVRKCQIDRSKTLEENSIKDGDLIAIN